MTLNKPSTTNTYTEFEIWPWWGDIHRSSLVSQMEDMGREERDTLAPQNPQFQAQMAGTSQNCWGVFNLWSFNLNLNQLHHWEGSIRQCADITPFFVNWQHQNNTATLLVQTPPFFLGQKWHITSKKGTSMNRSVLLIKAVLIKRQE